MITKTRRVLHDSREAIGKCSIATLTYLAWAHKDYFKPQSPKEGKHYLKTIMDDICYVFDVDSEYLSSPKKKRERAIVRFIYCNVAKIKTKATLKEIGALIGGRDHTTVLNAIRVFKDLTDKKDPQFIEYWEWYRNKSNVW